MSPEQHDSPTPPAHDCPCVAHVGTELDEGLTLLLDGGYSQKKSCPHRKPIQQSTVVVQSSNSSPHAATELDEEGDVDEDWLELTEEGLELDDREETEEDLLEFVEEALDPFDPLEPFEPLDPVEDGLEFVEEVLDPFDEVDEPTDDVLPLELVDDPTDG